MLDVNRRYGIFLDTPLHKAANIGNRVMVQLLLDRGANPNKAEENGDTPLHKAAMNGHKAVAKLLLKRGAEVNRQDKYGSTPLLSAAHNSFMNRTEMVKILLEGGAMPDITDGRGRTPLYVAHEFGRTEVATVLMNHTKKK